MRASPAWEAARRVLCVRLDSLGDVLMTTPAIRAVKESLPSPAITLLTSPSGAQAARLVPQIDEVLVYDAPWVKTPAAPSDRQAHLDFVERLARGRYDAAILFTVFTQSPLPAALMACLAGIPLRLAHCRENPYQLLTHWVRESEPRQGIRHEVRRQLDLVATIGCRPSSERLELQVPERSHRRVLALLRSLGLDFHEPWVVIHPGATAESRRYPHDGYAQVARQLLLRYNIPALFTGSTGELPLVERIRSLMQAPSFSLAGRLDFPDLVALIRLAPLLITNNTGPAHVAAATGTPLVDLYALTNPQHAPWKVPHRLLNRDVPCKYCYRSTCPEGHHRCLRGVDPQEIVQAALELLQESRVPQPLAEARP